jgi:hypothetical protein
MTEPDLDRGKEGFASAGGFSDLEFEQERPRKIIHGNGMSAVITIG